MKAKKSELALLRLVADAGGSIDHEDERLLPFCDDGNPDTFNNCHSLGWLKTTRDDRTETSVAHLTKYGRELLEELKP